MKAGGKIAEKRRQRCCQISNSRVFDTRTSSSKNYRHLHLSSGIKWRQRQCKTCGMVWETYEGDLKDIFQAFKNSFIALLHQEVEEAKRKHLLSKRQRKRGQRNR